MDEIKLKPCPFCGGKPKVLKGVCGKPIKEDLQNTMMKPRDKFCKMCGAKMEVTA